MQCVSEVAVDEPLELVVVDLMDIAAPDLSPYDPVIASHILHFDVRRPQVFPEAAQLVALCRAWLRTAAEELMGFYSAIEPEEPGPGAKVGGGLPAANPPKAKAKRVTTAHLAEQLQSLLHMMPAMSDQMQSLAQQQELEARVTETQSAPPLPLHRQPFQLPVAKGPPVPGLSLFGASLDPPPKIRQPPRLAAPAETNPVGPQDAPASILASPSMPPRA